MERLAENMYYTVPRWVIHTNILNVLHFAEIEMHIPDTDNVYRFLRRRVKLHKRE